MINENIKKFLISKNVKVKEAMKMLSDYGCKILFIHDDYKLKASLTDGDIRRYILSSGDIESTVDKAANFNPKYLINASKREAKKYLNEHQIDALPVVNDGLEIIDIYFTNYKFRDSKNNKINIPVAMMAGGKGTRLYPFTKVLPKPLIPVGDVPIAERIINRFYEEGCNDFYLIVNHMKNMIKSYFNEIDKPYNVNFVDEEEPLGTGGGLFYLKGKINQTFILTNCDILIETDFYKALKNHMDNKNVITMIVAMQNIQVPYGVVEFDNNYGITSMKEKPQISYYTNTGCYIVEPSVIDSIVNKENIGFPDIINRCKDMGMKVGVYPISEESFIDMGEIDKLNNVNKLYF